jgi:predicted RNA-binding protein associated with RNAse of E/G family
VESVDEREIDVVFPAGTWFDAPTPAGRKLIRRDCRSIFWPGVSYFLTEAYEPDGRLGQLFVDIASPPKVESARITYIDFELDIIMPAGSAPFVDDEDEFLAAVEMYGYSAEHQEHCRLAVEEALRLVETWTPRGAPTLLHGRES